MEIMLLAKNKPENRIKIARAGAIKPLISLISSSDHILQENGSSEDWNSNGQRERSLRTAPLIANRRQQNRNRTDRSDSTPRESSRNW
ncbi:hypothetical protein U1Q18_007397 [Sarracenia purpurea var. burkii]